MAVSPNLDPSFYKQILSSNAEFEVFMDNQIKECVQNGALEEWDKVREPGDPFIPVVVSPLGVEPSKPRALWDGRYVNEFCRDILFSMDNASKIAEVAWEGVYFFKYFGIFWKGIYYVFAVLPFGWKSSPLIYHSLTEAVAMYVRSLGIPMLVWIDDMCGMTEQEVSQASDEEQFQSALRSMVVTSYVLFKAGYFLGLSKCFLIPEQYITYLGIDCDSKHQRFFVPEKRIQKYIPLLQNLLAKQKVSFSEIESVVGKLVSLDCAVLPGMWYTRNQYAAMQASKVKSDDKKALKRSHLIPVTNALKEEWYMWIYFLTENKGAPWKNFCNVLVKADVSSDASGRAFAGVVDFPMGETMVTAREFSNNMLSQDIQVKEGEALRATLSMIVTQTPHEVYGKTLVCFFR